MDLDSRKNDRQIKSQGKRTLSNVYDEQYAKEIISRGLEAVDMHLKKLSSQTQIVKIEFENK